MIFIYKQSVKPILLGGLKMKKQLFLLASLCLLLSACDRDIKKPEADNTGLNVRDRNERALTSGNQSESEIDRTITQKIRQAIMEDDSLSTNAKNIKIVSINGVVTLRGPVNSDKEKSEIARKARSISGVKSIDNQLEIVLSDNAADR